MACTMAETLLTKVVKEYSDQSGQSTIGFKKLETSTGKLKKKLTAPLTKDQLVEMDRRPQLNEVDTMIEMRNLARRSCKFDEADEVRELLRQHGVAVMDEKGGRGKGNEVTTWKYWKPV